MFRFSCPVFPSEDDHVVTSPYNATLAASVLVNSAHCVLPLENQALAAISTRLEAAAASGQQGGKGAAAAARRASTTASAPTGPAAAAAAAGRSGSSVSMAATANLGGSSGGSSSKSNKQGGWDVMNGLAANLLLHLTSSIRFEGSLNTDLNDITMNLVGVCGCAVLVACKG